VCLAFAPSTNVCGRETDPGLLRNCVLAAPASLVAGHVHHRKTALHTTSAPRTHLHGATIELNI
jgi:hypothetical protein